MEQNEIEQGMERFRVLQEQREEEGEVSRRCTMSSKQGDGHFHGVGCRPSGATGTGSSFGQGQCHEASHRLSQSALRRRFQ